MSLGPITDHEYNNQQDSLISIINYQLQQMKLEIEQCHLQLEREVEQFHLQLARQSDEINQLREERKSLLYLVKSFSHSFRRVSYLLERALLRTDDINIT